MVGAVDFKAGDATYTMQFDFNALCRVEEESGVEIEVFFADFEKRVSLRNLRLLVWASLAKHHGVSLEEAGDIVQVAGGVGALIPVIEKATKAAFPQGESGKKTKARG